MDAVRTVDVRISRPAEHHGIALGAANVGMSRRISVVIGLDLDNHAADAVDE